MKNIPDAEEFSGSGTEGNVGTSKVVDGGLGEHGVVLKLRLAQRGGVARDQDQLGYSNRKNSKASRTGWFDKREERRERR